MWWNKVTIRRKAEILGLMLVTISLFVLLSLITHNFNDDRWFSADAGEVWTSTYHVHNSAGVFGGWFAFVLITALGVSSVALPITGLLFGLRMLFGQVWRVLSRRVALVLAVLFIVGILVNLKAASAGIPFDNYALSFSGAVGYWFSGLFSGLLGVWGAGLILVCILGGMAYLLFPWHRIAVHIPSHSSTARSGASRKRSRTVQKKPGPRWSFDWPSWKNKLTRFGRVILPEKDVEDIPVEKSVSQPDYLQSEEPPPTERDPVAAMTATPAPAGRSAKTGRNEPSRKVKLVKRKRPEFADFDFPSEELLANPPERDSIKKKVHAGNNAAAALKAALATFDIGIIEDSVEVFPGPVITRLEFQPAPGVKVNQIVNLADDLALVLRARRIRIVAPVPGKAAVGVEVPNPEAEDVYIREILQSPDYADADLKLPLALGKDIGGRPFVTDLSVMPHLLIAGATGSGKSVCINAIITSLLFRLHPRELRFLFVDPKMLELSIYEGIPHLEKSVVSRPRGAERLLEDCVREMDDRYKKLSSVRVRNLAEYNARAAADDKLPYIVVIVDELADLMMSSSANKIETLITRLAQMARAVGIHLVLATQRPSVDVITGLIKANFSSRIAFQVASKVDSRTILDANGAEKLLGRGDMLFVSPTTPEPVRLHGAYVSGEETERMVDFFKAQTVETTKIESFDEEKKKQREQELDPEDMVLRQAAEVVVRNKQGSVSLLQRRLGVGYQRAARLIDKLEEAGIVGPYDGSKAREVLVDKAGLTEIFNAVTQG